MSVIIKDRKDMPDEFKWRINDIYPSDEAWEKDYRYLLDASDKKSIYEGRIGDSAENLAAALIESDECDMIAEKMYVYAFMRYYEDTANAAYQEMSGKAAQAITKLNSKYAFLTPEIMAIDDALLQRYIDNNEKLKHYEHMLNDITSRRKHTLSNAEERILSALGTVANGPSDIFSKFNNADVKFADVMDENGKTVKLTQGRYSVFMESRHQEVRKDAFIKLYASYEANINTLAAIFNANAVKDLYFANTRHYDSALAMHLSSSFIPTAVYDNLIDEVNSNLKHFHRYVDLRKQALGLEQLHYYDLYAPMVSGIDKHIDYEEAKQIALHALTPLGEDYQDMLKECFSNGWVDVYENTGKRTGAFSWGEYGTHPYVFMNYSDTLNDVFTLVHECGHAMHTYLSNANQSYTYAGYRIFVAEVASTCNEVLLIHYLLDNAKDDREKAFLINHYLEQFKGTLFRQTMFAEFEKITSESVAKGEILNASKLCNIYQGLNDKYFGDVIEKDSQIQYEWARIPHFYTPFYVYQYATGFSAAIAIASSILKGDKKVLKGYKKFLSSGSSLHPIELLKLAGVDMESREPVASAMQEFAGLLDLWEETIKKF